MKNRKMLAITICILTLLFGSTASNLVEAGELTSSVLPTFTEVTTASFPGLHAGAAKWGDYDNDDDLDLLVTGDPTFSSNYITKLYRNDGGSFTEISTGMQAIGSSTVDWGDYDNDGDLDILLVGITSSFSTVSKIYRNDGSSGPTSWTFTDIGAALSPSSGDGAGWADFDNDGDLDVYITGLLNFVAGTPRVGKVYLNNGTDVFIDSGALIGAVSSGRTDTGDFDNDGDIDIIINGLDDLGTWITKIYQNNGNASFTELDVGLNQVADGPVAWGDFDDDGDLDILLSGRLPAGPTTNIYRNDGPSGSSWVFTEITTAIEDLRGGYTEWGDFDNDGDLDILITGSRTFGIDLRTKIYRNDGSAGATAWNFTDTGAPLTDVANGLGAIADYDVDGDLDIFLMGVTSSSAHISKLYRNDCPVSNSPPAAPTALTVTVNGDATLSWNMSTDDTTPSQALCYNLRVGTSPGGSDVVAPMAALNNGYRRIVGRGSADINTSWELKNLSPGVTYYWSVQAIDHAYAGSPFAQEGTFSRNLPPDCSGAFIADQPAGPNCIATISGADVSGVTDPDNDPLTIAVSPTTLSLGANTVTVTADDGNGGTCSINITVSVTDATAPAPTVANLPDATGECSVTLTSPTAEDNCAGTITATTNDPLIYTTQGTFTVTWNYDDGNGNTNQQTQTIIVADVTPPMITLNDANPLTLIRFSGPYVEPGAVITENCDPSPSLTISGTVDTNLPGQYIITYDATDASGNTSQATRTVNVIDDPNVLDHPYLYLADKKIKIDKIAQSEGDMYSNDEIDIKKGPATFEGDVIAVGKIDIAKDVTIDGNVTAGGELQLDNNVTITGTASEFANVSAESLPQLNYSAGGNNVKIYKNQTLALAPGSYGKIEVEKDATLQLSSGEYFFEELKLKEKVSLEIDLAIGPVIVNVVKKVDVAKDMQMLLIPLGESDSRYVTINSLEDIQIDKGSVLMGTFNAPDGKVHLKKDVNLRGSICSEEIDVDKDAVALHHDAAETLPLTKVSSPPEEPEAVQDFTTTSIPTEFALEQNYPNPFNPSTVISFAVPEAAEVRVAIYNLKGQLIRILHSGPIGAGYHGMIWEGTNLQGAVVASGIYIYSLEAKDFKISKKLTLV